MVSDLYNQPKSRTRLHVTISEFNKGKIQGPYMPHGPYRVHTRFYQVKKVQARDIRSLRLLIGTRFNNIVFFFVCHILGMSQAYLRNIQGISWAYLGHILGISCLYLGHTLCISWAGFGLTMVVYLAYLGHIFCISRAYLGNILGIA